tara:strand:+ start:3432 stop:7058 length:3627 start_codon:yes stop_codon:yes gene_type:complete
MSIFQESFQSYVDLQLKIREAILKNGNTNNRFGSAELSQNTIIEDETSSTGTSVKVNDIRINPGAFYTNTVERQCTIRLSSGVDIENSSDTAKNWILEAGIPKKEGGQRDGFIHGDRKGNAYGDPTIFSDADDGFGIVPMPGIVDANIRTKSAYGSLREAQINFVCHNRRQLEVLERLYMRPGFMLLLEWQWTPYINNKGKTEKQRKTLSSKNGIFWDDTSTFDQMQKQIHAYKKLTGGNYDGFLGLCKNFSFKATTNGGYECTTEIISTGEILDGLKGKKSGFKIKNELDNELRELDNLEFYLEAIKEYGTEGFTRDEVSGKKEAKTETQVALFEAFQELASAINPKRTRLFEATNDEELSQLNVRYKLNRKNRLRHEQGIPQLISSKNSAALNDYGSNYTYKTSQNFQNELNEINDILDTFIISKGEDITINNNSGVAPNEAKNLNSSRLPSNLGDYGSPKTYVRWDFLAHIMNSFVLEEYKEKEPIAEITWSREIEDGVHDYLNYTTNKVESDPIIKKQTKDEISKSDESNTLDKVPDFPLNNILGMSLDPSKCLFPHQLNQFFGSNQSFTSTLSKGNTAYATNYSIGLIFFSVEYLLELYANERYNEDGSFNKNFKILNFIKKLWEEDTNNTCANSHTFLVHQDKENTSHVRVIDLAYQGNQGLQPDDLYEFNIQDNKTIVRDFNFNSTIPSALASTMAIVAQDPRSIGDVESVTVDSLNKDLTSRFSAFNNVYDYSDSSYEARQKKEKELRTNAQRLYAHNLETLTGIYNEEKSPNTLSVSAANKLYQSVVDAVDFLQARYPLTNTADSRDFRLNGEVLGGVLRKKIKSPKSAIIPLKFTCLLDGIGGIIIGNVFRVNKNRLPLGYQGKDVAFIVHAESQTITSGQDWTTEISGQLILLDVETEKDASPGIVISPGNPDIIYVPGDPVSPTPNADKLREALQRFGSYFTEKDNEISNAGDISEEMAAITVSILSEIYLIGGQNGFLQQIEITGGNDLAHASSTSSRHAKGNAIDFVLTPRSKYKITSNNGRFSSEYNEFASANNEVQYDIDRVESIIQGFVGSPSADGDIRYLNEYNYPTRHAEAVHFHMSYQVGGAEGGPTGFGRRQNKTGFGLTGSIDNLTLSQQRYNDFSNSTLPTPLPLYDDYGYIPLEASKFYRTNGKYEIDYNWYQEMLNNPNWPHPNSNNSPNGNGQIPLQVEETY